MNVFRKIHGVSMLTVFLVMAFSAVRADGMSEPPGQAESQGMGGAGTGSGAATGKANTGQTSPGRATSPAAAVVYMLVPVDVAMKGSPMLSGCWARIYDRENFSGENLTLAGPISLADMTGPFGINWDDRVKSIETGPAATVTVYDNENYRDLVAQFKPGQRVTDVSKRMGFFDEFASVKVDCRKS